MGEPVQDHRESTSVKAEMTQAPVRGEGEGLGASLLATTSGPGRQEPRFIAECPGPESPQVWAGGGTALSGVSAPHGSREAVGLHQRAPWVTLSLPWPLPSFTECILDSVE